MEKKELYIVKIKKGRKDKAKRHGRVKHEFEFTDSYVTELRPDEANVIWEDDDVEYVEPNGRLFTVGGEQSPVESWGLDKIYPPMDGRYAWAYDGTGVEAHIIDTGVRLTHHEFTGRASLGYFPEGTDGSDPIGHGTHVAAIVGGAKYGVAKNVKIFGHRITAPDGYMYIIDALYAIEWITKRKAKGRTARTPMVANMSFGFSGNSQSINNAINTAVDTGVVMVAAAGNYSNDAKYYSPSSAEKAMTVGASNQDDTKASYSNWGDIVDIWAPGSVIPSAWNGSDDAMAYKSGTSMAAPFVCGAAALILDRTPKMAAADVINELKLRATDGAAGKILNVGFVT